ncbi:MAG: Carbohydrate binding domain [Bacteroidetes bacterium]|nr:Carbohydrate binding domain [Bacteroidota bacterium]
MSPRIIILAALSAALAVPGLGQGGKNLVKNGEFERFAGDDPAGWETTSIPKVCVVVSASTTAHGGKTAARLEVKECFGSKFPGMITQKNIPITGGSTYTMRMAYVVKSVGGDVGYVSMEFENAEGSTVRVCEERLHDTGGAFKTFTSPFQAPDAAVSGELKVAMLTGKDAGSLHVGTHVIVDDIVLVKSETP